MAASSSALLASREAALRFVAVVHCGKSVALGLQGLMLELSLLTSLQGCCQLSPCSYLMPQFYEVSSKEAAVVLSSAVHCDKSVIPWIAGTTARAASPV